MGWGRSRNDQFAVPAPKPDAPPMGQLAGTAVPAAMPEKTKAQLEAEEKAEASKKAGSLGLLVVFEQANVKDVAAEAIARAVAWCDEQMVGSVDDIKGDHELITAFLKALDEPRAKAKVKIRKALGGYTLGADLLELLEGANAAGDEVVARLVSWCDDGWSSKIGSVDRMKGFANQPSIDALLKALDLPKVPANKIRKALDYNEQQPPPTTSQPSEPVERDAREMSRRLQDKSREQQELRRQQEIPAEKARMRTVFDSFDHNSDGYIDSSELEGVLSRYGITASREKLQQVLARYDYTTDGRLDFDEFEQLVSDVNAHQDEGGAGWADAFLRSSVLFFQSMAHEAGERGGWLHNVFPASSPAAAAAATRLNDDGGSPAAAAATRLNGSLTDDGALGPISGVRQAPLLDLTSAAKQTDVNDIDMHAYMANAKAEGLQASGELGGLTVDEAAAIALYTAESAFYRTLNECLRQRDRSALKPFFPYLRLLLQARYKLPKHTQAVWRGVKGVDLTKDFPKGKKIFWWQFTSTSKNVSTLLNPMFLGTSGTRTQFMIEAISGIDVQRFSMLDSEAEVLLFPGTQLEVVDVATIAPGLYQVHLKEITVPMELFK